MQPCLQLCVRAVRTAMHAAAADARQRACLIHQASCWLQGQAGQRISIRGVRTVHIQLVAVDARLHSRPATQGCLHNRPLNKAGPAPHAHAVPLPQGRLRDMFQGKEPEPSPEQNKAAPPCTRCASAPGATARHVSKATTQPAPSPEQSKAAPPRTRCACAPGATVASRRAWLGPPPGQSPAAAAARRQAWRSQSTRGCGARIGLRWGLERVGGGGAGCLEWVGGVGAQGAESG